MKFIGNMLLISAFDLHKFLAPIVFRGVLEIITGKSPNIGEDQSISTFPDK